MTLKIVHSYFWNCYFPIIPLLTSKSIFFVRTYWHHFWYIKTILIQLKLPYDFSISYRYFRPFMKNPWIKKSTLLLAGANNVSSSFNIFKIQIFHTFPNFFLLKFFCILPLLIKIYSSLYLASLPSGYISIICSWCSAPLLPLHWLLSIYYFPPYSWCLLPW